MLGLTADGTMESGEIIRCMAGDTTYGQMPESTLVNTNMIGNMDRESTCGQMEEFTMVHGRKDYSME